MSSGPRLVVVDPNGTRRDVAIANFPFRIGRQAGNELTLRDSRVSRQQAQITDVSGTMVLEDMGSSHGTFVNGEKIVRHDLKVSDQIDFGVPDSYRVIYVGEGATIDELVERIEAPAPAEAGARELHHLSVLLDVARSLSSGLSLEDILASVVDAAIAVTRTERGVLLLANPAGQLETAVARNARRGTLRPEEMQVSQGVVKRVASSRRELIVGDTVADAAGAGRMNQGESITRLDLHTVVAIPIDKKPVIEAVDATVAARQSELLGILYLDSRAPSSTFSALDREVVRTLAHEAATLIENARLFAAGRVKARLDHDIEIASKIQLGLLPKELPNLPHVAMAGSTLACYSVGGDCFDVIELDGGRHGFFLGDISGKGIPAALLATLLQGIFYTTASMDIEITSVFSRVNRYLCERAGGDRYATVFYGVLDKTGAFQYVNAGHVPPLIRRNSGAIERLDLASFPVGMFPEAEYESAAVKLEQDDFLVIYTDGVSEAVNVKAEMFEEERLQHVLQEFKGQTVEELAEAIRESVRVFSEGAAQSDDITILVVQYKGTAG
ncbi:MAG TPA: SpoIIE family protein phosphatase [Candidatus Acidoferrales bacterium]|jgi:sigma-B regulation protein RsbU (phosphoserine phosphatase)|nr:SpoIIE family protein phosphatase [Candidatus Acidoferrales bacterium]